MRPLVLNGGHRAMHGVGQGVYAQRLVEGLLRHANPRQFQITILAPQPAPNLFRSQPGANWRTLRSPTVGHPLLDTIAWNQRLLAHRSLFDPDALFFSPGPCWGWRAPNNLLATYPAKEKPVTRTTTHHSLVGFQAR